MKGIFKPVLTQAGFRNSPVPESVFRKIISEPFSLNHSYAPQDWWCGSVLPVEENLTSEIKDEK